MRRALVLFVAAAACGRATKSEPPTPAPAPSQARPTSRPAPTMEPRPHPSPPPAAVQAVDPLAGEAAKVVDRQNEAYNRHDLEGFLSAYADSVVIQALNDTVPIAGKSRLRESIAGWFAEAPAARTEVVERMVLGPFVVDRQRVTGGAAGQALDAIGIYEVREGLIRRVWSIPPPPSPH